MSNSLYKNIIVRDVMITMGNFPVVKNAMLRRHKAINHPEWVFAMSVLINSKKSKYFRS